MPFDDVAAAFVVLGAGDGLELAFVLLVPPPWLAEGTDTMIQVEAQKIDGIAHGLIEFVQGGCALDGGGG